MRLQEGLITRLCGHLWRLLKVKGKFEQFSLADDCSRPRSEALALHLNLCLETKIASFAVGPFRAFQPRV